MSIRVRNGKLEWRFMVNGHEYSGVTGLADTPRNRTRCARLQAMAMALVLEGKGAELHPEPFDTALNKFMTWAKGEYSAHPNSWKRIRSSLNSASEFFQGRPLCRIDAGDLEDFKTWRRREQKVKPVSLRHDLHGLSKLFQYGIAHRWCTSNPVREVTIPSDADAIRMNVLSRDDEARYFATCEQLRMEKIAGKRYREAKGLADMADLHRLMLLQGCRPEELRALEQEHVDLERGEFTIVRGKSAAARRTLRMRSESREIFTRRLDGAQWVFPGNKPGRHIGVHQRPHNAVVTRSRVTCCPYDFRHTCATRWAEAGIDATIAAWLGHGSLRSVQKYIHPSKAHLNAEAERYEMKVMEEARRAVLATSKGLTAR